MFYSTLNMILLKYHHNPQLHCNVLAIISNLTDVELIGDKHTQTQTQTDTEENTHRDFIFILNSSSQLLNMNLLKDTFEIYRWRVKNTTYKLINQFHLNILVNFSNFAMEFKKKENSTEDTMRVGKLLALITEDFKNYYNNPIPMKKFNEILLRKRENLEVHSQICKIGANITRDEEVVRSLIDSLFFEDVIGYLININNDGYSGGENENKTTSFDFLLYIREKKKNIPFEQIKKDVYFILEKSAEIILNIMVCPSDIIKQFMSKVNNLSYLNLLT